MAAKAVTTKSVTTKTHAAVRLPRAERREQIVRAAASAFLTSGYDKTSMEDVANAAGVTRLIVYRIFESKEALYLAVLEAVIDDLALRFEPGTPNTSHEPGLTISATLLGIARRHPDGFRLLWRHASNQAEFQGLFTLFKAAATDYAIALISGVSPDPVVVHWAAESVVSHVYESICIWLDDGDPTLDAQFLRMLGDGMRAMVTAWGTGPRR
jgi:AcrR family transcriptional regulator